MKSSASPSLRLAAIVSGSLLACQPSAIRQTSGASHHLSAQNLKVGLYTDSSFATFQSEQSALQSAGASTPLQLYLNYADFANFEGNPSPGQGIVDVSALNQANVQLVLAFEPTNASFCTHPSKTTGNSTGGCRLSELTASSAYAVQAGNAYAKVAALADAWPDEPWTPGFDVGARVAGVCESMERSVAQRRWVAVDEVTGPVA